MKTSRIAWTLWALIPVLALAFHFGPGQRAFHEDRAARLLHDAQRLHDEAVAAQDVAYDAHLRAIAARIAAKDTEDPALLARVTRANDDENLAYAAAADAWKRTADTLGLALESMADSDEHARQRVRLTRARALVRAGEITSAEGELQDILDWHASRGTPDHQIALDAREELATAYYYGARLLRIAGRPGEQWREASGRARQNFRYLAERARLGDDGPRSNRHELNGELVLNLEQSALSELFAQARPRESPQNPCDGLCENPGKKRRPQPRNPRQGAGAGYDGEIGQGW